MATAFDIALALLVAFTIAPMVLLFLTEILASMGEERLLPQPLSPPFAVLVPAHNERAVIAETIQSIQKQLRQVDRILVVADNCNDDTAAIARALGTTVIERNDPSRHGKGFALAYGVRALMEADTPQITVIVDADCLCWDGALEALAAVAAATGRPVQGDYQFVLPSNASSKMRLSAFAFRVKNFVRRIGCARLGMPSLLTGSGMAFPTKLLSSLHLETSEIVEDHVMGLDLALAGKAPLFCRAARIRSAMPTNDVAQRSQRTRWEQGQMSVASRYGARLIMAGLSRRSAGLIFLGIDITIPPLTLLMMMLIATTGAALVWTLVTNQPITFILLSILCVALLLAVMLAWILHARDLLSPVDLAALSLAIPKKLPFYIGLLFSRPVGWIKTNRGD